VPRIHRVDTGWNLTCVRALDTFPEVR